MILYKKALRIMAKADVIKVFAVANLNFIGEEFVFKLNRIHKRAYIEPVQDNQFQDAIMTTSNECAICLSYSGETLLFKNCTIFKGELMYLLSLLQVLVKIDFLI